MHFFIDNDHKVIFGWSPKCGCSHVMKLCYFLTTGEIDHKIHTGAEICKLPDKIDEYHIFIVMRNPYERIISGFLDRYGPDRPLRHLWKSQDKLTFQYFVNELSRNGTNRYIEKYHFTPQTSGDFNDKITNGKTIKIYDLKNIDYAELEKMYNVKIPQSVLDFTGHAKLNKSSAVEGKVYDLCVDDLYNNKIDIQQFFHPGIYAKIGTFYKKDFEFYTKMTKSNYEIKM